MLRPSFLDYRTWVTLAIGIVFGVLFVAVIPFLSTKPIFLLALPVSLLFFLFLVIKPKWTLMILFLSRPFLDNLLSGSKVDVSQGDSGSGGFGIGAIFNLAIILLSAFLVFYTGNYPRRNKLAHSWIIFLLVMSVVVLYSPYKFTAVRLLFNYLSYFAMFLLPFLVVKQREDFVFWLKLLAVSFILPVLFANVDMLHGGHYYTDAGMRVQGTFAHPNILAFYLVLGITVYFFILQSGHVKSKPWITWSMRLMILDMLVLLIHTKTRNAWMACLAMFLIYGFLKDRKFLIGVILVLPLSLAVPQVQDRVLTILQGKESNDYQGMNSYQWRLGMWQSCIPLILKRPLQGYGMTSFVPMSETFSTVGKNGAHSVYLQLLFETGIIGLLSFLPLFLKPLLLFLKNMFRSKDPRQAQLWAIMLAYVISYLMICSADNLLYYLAFNWYVWFFLGLMWGASQKEFILYD
jgi:O-antigen ligase